MKRPDIERYKEIIKTNASIRTGKSLKPFEQWVDISSKLIAYIEHLDKCLNESHIAWGTNQDLLNKAQGRIEHLEKERDQCAALDKRVEKLKAVAEASAKDFPRSDETVKALKEAGYIDE